MRHRPAVKVEVSEHARVRAARIVDEVRAALCEGRVEAAMEQGLLHAWTPDGIRRYALRAHPMKMVVTTTMRREQAA